MAAPATPDINAAGQIGGTPYGTLPPASPMATRRPISLPRLLEITQAEAFAPIYVRLAYTPA